MTTITEDLIARRLGKHLADRSECVIRDDKLTGFSIRVRKLADGGLSKTFFIDRLEKGKRKKTVIGMHPTFGVEAARAEATTMLQAVKKGDDPAAERIRKKEALTLAELWTDFEEKYLCHKEASTRRDYAGRWRRVLKPTLGHIKLHDITSPMVAAMKSKYCDKPTEANRGIAVGKKMFSYAIEKGHVTANPFKSVKLFTETAREDWLDEHDLPLFKVELGKRNDPIHDVIRLMLLGGWRISHARLLRWEHVDLMRRSVDLPDNATKKTATVLSTAAAQVLAKQPHRSGYVFSNSRGRNPIGDRDIRDELAAICEAAGVKRITPHVLRHTAATWGVKAGLSDKQLQQAIGWKSSQMANRYVARAAAIARHGTEQIAAIIDLDEVAE